MSDFKADMQAKTVYFGNQKIKKILMVLGANQSIANNPRVIEAVSTILEEICEIKDIEEAIQEDDNENVSYAKEVRTQKLEAQLEGMFPEYAFYQKGIPDEEKNRILQLLEYLIPGKQCSDEELGHIVEVLKKCIPLSNEGLKKWIELKRAPEGSRIHKYGVYHGIRVNEDGSVDIQKLTVFRSGGYTEEKTTFKIRGLREIEEISIQEKIGSDSREEKFQISVIETTGVVKEREVRRKLTISQKNEEEYVKIMRNHENPTIVRIEKGEQVSYSPIDLNQIHDLPDVICNSTVKLYNTLEEARDNTQYPDIKKIPPRYKYVAMEMLEKAGFAWGR